VPGFTASRRNFVVTMWNSGSESEFATQQSKRQEILIELERRRISRMPVVPCLLCLQFENRADLSYRGIFLALFKLKERYKNEQ
jgi:hypothetical protein